MKTVYSKRLTKKYCKRVADGLWNDKITPFYAKRVEQIFHQFLYHMYETIFRPWYWDQDWKKLNLSDEIVKHTNEMIAKFHRSTGIHPGMFRSYLETVPKCKRGRRKKKEPKEKPIRKLRNPQGYKIHVREVGGKQVWHNVIAEPAFSIRGYEFFICHYNGLWTVSDVTTGRRVWDDTRYKVAIQRAREQIEQNFDKYVAYVNALIKNEE